MRIFFSHCNLIVKFKVMFTSLNVLQGFWSSSPVIQQWQELQGLVCGQY
jgi:hypothetical protein